MICFDGIIKPLYERMICKKFDVYFFYFALKIFDLHGQFLDPLMILASFVESLTR